MPLMKLACTALERVPLTRPTIIEHLMKKFNQDLVFYRASKDNDLTRDVHGTLLLFFFLILFLIIFACTHVALNSHDFSYLFVVCPLSKCVLIALSPPLFNSVFLF